MDDFRRAVPLAFTNKRLLEQWQHVNVVWRFKDLLCRFEYVAVVVRRRRRWRGRWTRRRTTCCRWIRCCSRHCWVAPEGCCLERGGSTASNFNWKAVIISNKLFRLGGVFNVTP